MKIIHPGPLQQKRLQTVKGTSTTTINRLPGGGRLVDELHSLLAASGHHSGVAEILGGSLSPISYCVPADGRSGRAVSYSETCTGEYAQVIFGTAVLGRRNGEPFMHCHCIWRRPDGTLAAGHLWPETHTVDPAPSVALISLDGIELTSADCTETLLPVFTPRAEFGGQAMNSDTAHPTYRTIVARVLPNEDITDAVVRICSDNGFSTATVRGGTGSLIGALFEPNNGGPPRKVDGPATEVVTLVGHLETDEHGQSIVHLSCTLVDKYGTVHAGRLVQGANPVSVTFELVVQKIDPMPLLTESHDPAASTDATTLKEK